MVNFATGWTWYVLEINVSDKRLKFGPPWNGHVQRFRGKESLQVKQVEVVFIHQVCQQLISQSIQSGHHW